MEISTTTNASQNCIESKNYLPLQKRGLQRELLIMFSYWTFVVDHEWVTMCFCTLSGNFIYKIYAIDVKSGGRLAALNDWNWLTSIEKYWNHTEDVPFTYRRFLYFFSSIPVKFNQTGWQMGWLILEKTESLWNLWNQFSVLIYPYCRVDSSFSLTIEVFCRSLLSYCDISQSITD